MAHQSDAIPWQSLADLMKPEFHDCEKGCLVPSDLVPRSELPDDIKDETLTRFVRQLAQAISHQVTVERQKYTEIYDEPDIDEVVISKEALKNILPSVKRWHHGKSGAPWCKSPEEIEQICTNGDENLVSVEKRKMGAFHKRLLPNHCHKFFEVNADGLYQAELISSLILRGEMDTVLRITSSPNVYFSNWRLAKACNCLPHTDGWGELYARALYVYFVLNVLYCYSDIWEPKAGEPPYHEYRSLKAYQHMLEVCLSHEALTQVPMQPHYDFFSIHGSEFGQPYRRTYNEERAEKAAWEDAGGKLCYCDSAGGMANKCFDPNEFKCGMMDIEKFMNRHSKSVISIPPPSTTIELARFGLASKGLPRELVENVLRFAGFIRTDKSQLRVPHHPFHPDNKAQLTNYLDECWQLVIRTATVCHHVANPMHRFGQPDWEKETVHMLRRICNELVSRKWLRQNEHRWTSHLFEDTTSTGITGLSVPTR